MSQVIEVPIFFHFPVKAPSGNSYAKAVAKKIHSLCNEGGVYVYPFDVPLIPMEAIGVIESASMDDKTKAVWAKIRLTDEELVDIWNPVDSSFTVEIMLKPLVTPATKVIGAERVQGLGPIRWWRSENG